MGDHLDEHRVAWFGAHVITHEDDGTTTLRGEVADQAQLHGLVAKVRDLGVTLISLTCDAAEPSAPTSAAPPSRDRAAPASTPAQPASPGDPP